MTDVEAVARIIDDARLILDEWATEVRAGRIPDALAASIDSATQAADPTPLNVGPVAAAIGALDAYRAAGGPG